MITTPEIICELFSFLNKDQIERIQLVNQFWNNVIIRHKNILPLRQFLYLNFVSKQIGLYAANKDFSRKEIYIIQFDGTNLSKGNVTSRYSQLTVDEVLTNLNDVVFNSIEINVWDSEDRLDNLLNLIKLATTKTGGRFRGRFARYFEGRLGSKQNVIFDNYIIVDELNLGSFNPIRDPYIREVCANPEIVQLPSTPKAIRLFYLKFKENDDALHFTFNVNLNGANRVTLYLKTSDTDYGSFIRQWFKLYCTHQNPISLVGKFELRSIVPRPYSAHLVNNTLAAVKTFLNNTQLRIKYILETKKSLSFFGMINRRVKRSCVLHETNSYALVIEMVYENVHDMSSINASDLDQPQWNQMTSISLCVKPFYKQNTIGIDEYQTRGFEETALEHLTAPETVTKILPEMKMVTETIENQAINKICV